MDELKTLIEKSRYLVFFGGAGVSTASGIPDFRSEDGLYRERFHGLTPEMMLSSSFFYLHPDLFYDFYSGFMLHPDAAPNAAHRALAKLEAEGRLKALVTQNIDGLHRAAGNRLVYEIHGTVHENHCLDCGRFYSLKKILESDGVPRCDDCGGVIKPSVTLYGEAPDKYAMTGACREISHSDVLIVAGTSLEVEPAASCLDYFHGKALVVINKEETPADKKATLVIHGRVEEVLGNL